MQTLRGRLRCDSGFGIGRGRYRRLQADETPGPCFVSPDGVEEEMRVRPQIARAFSLVDFSGENDDIFSDCARFEAGEIEASISHVFRFEAGQDVAFGFHAAVAVNVTELFGEERAERRGVPAQQRLTSVSLRRHHVFGRIAAGGSCCQSRETQQGEKKDFERRRHRRGLRGWSAGLGSAESQTDAYLAVDFTPKDDANS